MRILLCTLVLASVAALSGCNDRAQKRAHARTADSLAGAVSALADQLRNVDTNAIQTMISQYQVCMAFIDEHVHDTISRNQADQLQRLSVAGRQLQAFRKNRELLLARSSAVVSQLSALGADAASGSAGVEELESFIRTERSNAGTFTSLAVQELELYHSAVKQFGLSLPHVSELVRSYNQGRWPSVYADSAAAL